MTFVAFAWMIAAISGWVVAGVLGWAFGAARSRADWCLEGWNRTCVLNDKHRDLIERQYDRIHDLTTPSLREELGWLVEQRNSKTGEFKARWWALTGENGEWSTDANSALRFSRKADAESYIAHYGWTEAAPTEHIWPRAPDLFTTDTVSRLRSVAKDAAKAGVKIMRDRP